MSYVAVSSKFTSDVRNRLRHMRNKETVQVAEPDYRLSSSRPDLITWAWGEHLHLKEQMPEKWCGKIESTQLRFETQERGTFRVRVELSPPLVIPPGGTSSTIFNVSADDPEIKPIVDRETMLYDIVQRWNKVDEQILSFLSKCKSVNEALKLWPQIEMYLPSEYLERVAEKKERSGSGPSKAAEALKAMDTDHLTTAAVISRMSGQG